MLFTDGTTFSPKRGYWTWFGSDISGKTFRRASNRVFFSSTRLLCRQTIIAVPIESLGGFSTFSCSNVTNTV